MKDTGLYLEIKLKFKNEYGKDREILLNRDNSSVFRKEKQSRFQKIRLIRHSSSLFSFFSENQP